MEMKDGDSGVRDGDDGLRDGGGGVRGWMRGWMRRRGGMGDGVMRMRMGMGMTIRNPKEIIRVQNVTRIQDKPGETITDGLT